MTKPKNLRGYCGNCGKYIKIRKRSVKRRRCSFCLGKITKLISEKKYIEWTEKFVPEVRDVKVENDGYEEFWKVHDEEAMQDLYKSAKKFKLRIEDFITHLMEEHNKTIKESQMIANYFYGKEDLKKIIRK